MNGYRLDDTSDIFVLPTFPSFLVDLKTYSSELAEPDIFQDIVLQGDPETPENIERLDSALSKIPANIDRAKWVRILFALKSTRWKSAYDIALKWSQSAPDKFIQHDFDQDWKSEKHKPNGVTVGTVYHTAKYYGWTDPRKANRGVNDYGDLYNGARFAEKYNEIFLYCNSNSRWYDFDGSRWKRCEAGEAMRAAKTIATESHNKAVQEYQKDPTESAKRNLTHAMGVHRNDKRIEAILKMASSEPGMSIANPSVFDADPMRLNTRNGVVDLSNGTLIDAHPSLLCSRMVNASFDRAADCPMWLKFLDNIFDDDEVINYIQRILGYSLTGLVEEEKLFFMYGQGANGKSVFTNIIVGIFGNYAASVGVEILMRNQNDGESNRYKVRLAGARFISCNEIGVKDSFDDRKIKEITSRESIPARELYGESFDFVPTHKLWLRGNHKPSVLDPTESLWRRLVLIELSKVFNESDRISNLDVQILENERDGILAWMIDGCLKWKKEGLKTPRSISEVTKGYQTDTDIIGLWLDQNCEKVANHKLKTNQAFVNFQTFIREMGMDKYSQMTFSKQVAAKGFKGNKSNGSRYFVGLKLKDLYHSEDDL